MYTVSPAIQLLVAHDCFIPQIAALESQLADAEVEKEQLDVQLKDLIKSYKNVCTCISRMCMCMYAYSLACMYTCMHYQNTCRTKKPMAPQLLSWKMNYIQRKKNWRGYDQM